MNITWWNAGLLGCVFPLLAFGQNQVLISEFMASNRTTLADEDGDYSDWIELWNAGTNTVNLEGWHLTDNASQLTKWQLPATNLQAGAYLVVFASDKDRRDPGAPLHANFQLSANGEYLALVTPDRTNVVSAYAPVFPRQVADVSFGIPTVDGGSASNVAVQPSLWRYFPQPSPGQPNRSGVETLGAVIRGATFSPAQPSDTNDIQITARVEPGFGAVTNVTLVYRVMFNQEVSTPMCDDGAHGDGAVGDGMYAAKIPAGISSPRQMVRWYLLATDTTGNRSRWPVYAAGLEAPEYLGTVIADPAIRTQLPVFQYFIEHTNWCQVPGGYDKNRTNASVYFQGRFYDNVRVRLRGNSSIYWQFPKQSLKFDFNPGEQFVYASDRQPAAQINVNELWADKAYIRSRLSMEAAFAAAGVPAPDTFHLLTLRNTALYSVAVFVEEPDERFLSRNGLDPEGALYQMYNPLSDADPRPPYVPGVHPAMIGAEKKTRAGEDFSDLQALVNGIKPSNPNRTAFLFDNINLPEVINYCAANLVIQDWDRFVQNYFAYRDTSGTGEWQLIPWDAKFAWGSSGWLTDEMTASHPTFSHPLYGQSDYQGPYGKWNMLVDALYRTPVCRQMFLRRARTLLDQILQPPNTPAGQLKLEARIKELEALMGAEVEADKRRWGNPYGTNQTFAQALDLIRTGYLVPRRKHLFVTHGPPNGLIPTVQFAYPTPRFGAIEFNPTSGNQAQEYLTLSNAHPFALDLSGWQLKGGVQFTFRPGTVIPSNHALYLSPDVRAFRARANSPRGGQGLLVVGNYQGQLSARGESLELYDATGRLIQATNYSGSPTPAQQFLRVTEIMYNPAPKPGDPTDAQEYEYVELKNLSTNLTLDLAGVHFTTGIDFCFTGGAVTNLNPGQTVLVVKNLAAFAARYGAGFNIVGQYAGRLDNAGERLVLVDVGGEEILDFSYSPDWHPLTDGLGFSLVVVNDDAPPSAWRSKDHWRASGKRNGSPEGVDPPLVIPPILITEALTRTENTAGENFIEVFNPTTDTVDIGGWYLTDALKTPAKYRIPDRTTIAAGGYLVFTETDFNPNPGVPPSFSLNAGGGQVCLFSANAQGELTGYGHGFEFGAADDGVAFGHHVNSVGQEHFVARETSTPGAANTGPRVGPLVINEIMYHALPTATNDGAPLEFIELLAASGDQLPLFDSAVPANTWKVTGGVDFQFPANLTLLPQEFILLVGFDPASTSALTDFRTRYGIPDRVRIFGPFARKLSNQGDRVELRKPTRLHGTNLAWVLVDKVDYQSAAPWSEGANGFGFSLQRTSETVYGNDPTNWVAALANPGGPVLQGAAPIILTQPMSQTALAYTPVTLSVSATGATPMRYQWYLNGVPVNQATNASLVITSVLPEQAGEYQAAVFNDAGSVVSSQAILRVNIPPVITQQPANQTVSRGQTATFSVAAFSASATLLTCQWCWNGVDLPGQTNTTLKLTNVQTTDGGVFTARLTDAIGSADSAPATLTIIIPPRIAVPPASQSVVEGGGITFSVLLAEGTFPINYQWRLGTTPLTNLVLHSLQSFFTLSDVRAPQSGGYRVIISNAAQPNGLASSVATLTVLPDRDNDGTPDAWTEASFGHPTGQVDDGSRATDDADGDGMSNWQEYVAGTDPTDSLSFLQVDRLTPVAVGATLEFLAISNRTYTIEYTDALHPGLWLRLGDIAARPDTRVETMIDPSSTTNRFYRLATPRKE